jgi:hypothetical protein
MSRVDEFAYTSGTALITRIEWTDGRVRRGTPALFLAPPERH